VNAAEPLKIAGPPGKWTSRKLLVALLALVLVALNRKLGLDLAEADILALAGLAAAYVAGQGYVDGKQADVAVLECGEITCDPGSPVDGHPGRAVAASGCSCPSSGPDAVRRLYEERSSPVPRKISGTPWPDPAADGAAGSEERSLIREQAGFVRPALLAALLALSLALSGCAQHLGHPDRPDHTPQDAQLQTAKVEYGIKYLRGSLASVTAVAEQAKRDDPANAKYIDSQFAPVIEELSAAVDAYDTAYAAERESKWAWARALVGTAVMTGIRVGVPILIEQAAHR